MILGKRLYVADFETTTEDFFNAFGYTRVWCSCAVDINTAKRVHIGYSIEDFFKWLETQDKASIFFHNLKFDGEFILYFCLTHGYKYAEKVSEKNTYHTLIDDCGQWYLIELNVNGAKIKIYNSLKKLPFKVSELAQMLKLEEQKLEIDYDKFRPAGYIPTEEELMYVDNDCIIVARALKSLFDRGLKAMTLSGDAQGYYKRKMGKKYEYLYPKIRIDWDNDIRLSYKGGFVYCNKDYAGKIVEGCAFDVNSLYPYVLHSQMLPFGMPQKYQGKYKFDKHYPLYIQELQVDFKLKAGKLPTIQIKHSRFRDTDYLRESDGVVNLWLTKPDLELFLEHYDCLYIKYVRGYKFKQSNILFKDYVDYWFAEKTEGKRTKDPTRTLHAKLMLNSLYGRYGMGTCRINKLAHIEDDEVVHYSLSAPEFCEPQYTAVASFVTAYARRITITASQLCYEKGIYCYSDTDSVHIKGFEAPEGMKVDSFELGAWKNEGSFIGKFLRTKTYIKLKDENGQKHIEITCAGMPANIKEELKNYPKPFEAFAEGKAYLGKLVPKRVKGGVILVNTEFTIKVE